MPTITPGTAAGDLARLRGKPIGERRVALVLTAGAAGAAVAVLRGLRRAGYRVGDLPDDAAALVERLLAGPTDADPQRAADEALSFADYSAFFASLPPAVQQAVVRRWGAAERDPFFRPGRLDCGRFAIPGFREGNVAVLVPPMRGGSEPAGVPPHCHLAVHAWIADSFRADAIVDLGDRPTPEWLRGAVPALSADDCLEG